MNSLETFALRLCNAMDRKDISIAELSNESNVGLTSVYAYTNGERFPTVPVLLDICKTLNVSPDYLLGFALEPKGGKHA